MPPNIISTTEVAPDLPPGALTQAAAEAIEELPLERHKRSRIASLTED